MKVSTMLETITSLLGMPACAIPLSCCKPAKSYLLEKAGISTEGTAILFAVPYLVTADVAAPERNLSLYAVSRDYHGYMQALSREILPLLRERFPTHAFALFADHSPIGEVDAAARAGLGTLGMNGLLITPDYGSFVFLGEIVTDAPYEAVTGRERPDFPDAPPPCEGCGACLTACPAGCRNGCDPRVCLSAVTQKKGVLTEEDIAALRAGGLVWGCDACQLACPHNQRVVHEGRDTPIPYFREDRRLYVDTNILDAMTKEDFSTRAYAWRGPAVIRRNAVLLQEFPPHHERSTP